MSDIGGVWRTVGGRRIFIKDGEDLAVAMKNSGKFEKKDKYKKETQEIMDDIKYLDSEEEGFEEALEEIKERYNNLREKEGKSKSSQSKEIEGAIKELEKLKK